MMISARRYASHLPILTKLVEATSGPILELGVGLYSTPYLHWKCFPTKRKLTSLESDQRWAKYFRDCKADFHEIVTVESWDNIKFDKFWDIAFIDHSPDERRSIEAQRLAQNAKFVILHDSEAESDEKYKYSQIYPLFKYRFDYNLVLPNTTVLSNFEKLDNLNIQNRDLYINQ